MIIKLLRAVSHDIRTPLTSIVGATNVLLEQENTLTAEQRKQLLQCTNEDAEWLIRIVENLLSITRINNSEEARVKKAPEAAEEVIEGAVAKTHKHYPDVDIRVTLPDELMLVPMDPLLIEQVLVNLMENAVIHGGTSRIDVTPVSYTHLGQALVVHLRQRHAGEMLLPVDLHHGGGQIQGDIEIVQTLDDVEMCIRDRVKPAPL